MARPLVGRERELELLFEGLATLARGRGRLYLLTGEPGIGKTRLCDELAAEAGRRGYNVVWGAAWDGGGAPSYWPWIEVIRALRAELPAPAEPLRRDLGPLWHEPGTEPAEPAAHDPELARFRRYDALRAVLETAAAVRPLLVLLEDLHAADHGSLLALLLVASALRGMPVMIVATHRDGGGDDPERDELFARLARQGSVLALGRLGREHVRRLMADLDPVPERLVDEILAASGGNPLFLDETLRRVRTGARLGVPAGVSALIGERLGRLEPETRAALDLAAVLGRELDLAVLAETCGPIPPALLRARLRAPLAAGLLEELEGGRIRFAHGLYRERLLDDLAPDARALAHLRVAEALLRRRDAGQLETEEALAQHLLAACPHGDVTRAIATAAAAARRALAGLAFDRAIALYEGALAALAFLPAPAPPAERIDLELGLAEALARAGAGPRSRALCLAAAARARAAGDGVRLARAALGYGAELRIAVVDATLIDLLGEALARLGNEAAGLRARVLARLAAAEQPAPNPDLPVEKARAAIALARAGGEAETLLVTLHSAGSAMVDYAPPEERLALARELTALALPRGELTVGQQGYARIALDCLELDDVAEAEIAIAAHERLGRALGHPRWRWRSALLRSMQAVMTGRWDDAAAAQAEAARLAEEADDRAGAAQLQFHAAGALRAREAGHPRDVAIFEHEALTGLAYAAGILPVARASTLARFGDREAARRCLDTATLDLRALALDPMGTAVLCDAVILLEDRARAATLLPLLDRYEGRSLSWGVFGMIWEGPTAHFTGALLALLGQPEAAVPRLEEALAVAETTGARPLAARIGHELARALLARDRAGDRVRALALEAAAESGARALGMTGLAARIAAAPTQAEIPAPAPRAPAPSALVMTRAGEVWSVSFGGEATHLKHSRAVELLAELVARPGEELHVLDLGAAEPGAIDTGDAGELLDEDARAAYRARLHELRGELEEAEAWADASRRDRLRAEIEFLEEELARGIGLGGRARRAGAAVERARSNVQKRLRGVIRKLAESAPGIARHLEAEVRTGTRVSYRRKA